MDNQVNTPEVENHVAQVNQAINDQKDIPAPTNCLDHNVQDEAVNAPVQDDVIEGQPRGDYFIYEGKNGVIASFSPKLFESEICAVEAKAQKDQESEKSKPSMQEMIAFIAKIANPYNLNTKQAQLLNTIDAAVEGILAVAGILAQHSFEPQEGSEESIPVITEAYKSLYDASVTLNDSSVDFISRRNACVKQAKVLHTIKQQLGY